MRLLPSFLATALATLANLAPVPCVAQGADPAPALPSTPGQWRAAAVRDIEAGYRLTLANHAGTRDPHNPAFLANLEAARAHGQSLASTVADGGGYSAALLGFSSRIQDGHAGVYPNFEYSDVRPLQWPGFMAAWRGDLFVHAAEEGAAVQGERIVSCDGKPARELLEQNVFPFIGRMREEGQWWSQSRYLFIDTGNPFIARPQRCVFALDGRKTERILDWRAAPEFLWDWSRMSIAGDSLPVGLTEPRQRLFWVAMPTFQPSDKQRAAYHAIYEQVRRQRERFLNADAVVVDLRRNQGGSSWWSRDFAAALWGDAQFQRRNKARNAGVEIWYRASPGNIAYYQTMKEESKAKGDVESAEWASQLEAGMRAAQATDAAYHVWKNATADTAAQPAEPAPFTRPVYVIVPGNCASACLDAIDYFKLFPNTRLVGAPSSADSTYMEVRVEVLPGALARVVLPTKLWVNRPRGNGEFYRPDIPVNTLQWSTAGFLDVVERDLARLKASPP